MTTHEEALEQGWHTPVPTFFGPILTADEEPEAGVTRATEAFNWARQCPFTKWAVESLTTPEEPLVPRPAKYVRMPHQPGYLGQPTF